MLLTSYSLYANDELNNVLDSYHQAAAAADFKQYFALLADEGVFLGTDASERWSKKEFAQYVKPYFNQGKGWKYVSTERNFSPIAGTNLVFFDELLHNDHYGQCRGSGVLRLKNNQWQILQYNLSVMVPNEVSSEVVSVIRNVEKAN